MARFSDKDVVRHALVGRIVRAYEQDFETRMTAEKKAEGIRT